MNPLSIINKYFKEESLAYQIMVTHGQLVQKKALQIAKRVPNLKPDLKFIKEAAMLHDIGICQTDAPGLDCHGDKPYICHGIIGKKILKKEGLSKHALVCERHTGTGITKEEIIHKNLPLPKRDLLPLTIEEEIICIADKFYSKNLKKLTDEKSLVEIKEDLSQFGKDKLKKFMEWEKKYDLANL